MSRRLAFVATFLVGCSTARPVDETRRCATESACATVHPPGIADPLSPDFHAQLIVATAWDLDRCTQCHGKDFGGGISGKSCLSCHSDGPTACTTCHGQPPATGAHPGHTRFPCAACHPTPTQWTDVGHLFRADGSVIAQPQLTFGALALTANATPSFDGASCDGTYCHGSTLADPAARTTRPAWRGDPAGGACGSCHGLPPASHQNPRCSECHGRVVDASGAIVNAALHVDGKLSLGDDSGSCTACHPSPGGAHASHTAGTHRIARPLDCTECHLVPAAVGSAGHIDHERAEVFPAGSGALARTSQAAPSWDRAQQTCSDVYCHGGGKLLAADGAATIDRTPAWTAGSGAAVCGACHGVPPKDLAHAPTLTLSDCHLCHRTVDANGSLNVATHLNGIIDGP